MSLNIDKLSVRNPIVVTANIEAIIKRLELNQKLFNIVNRYARKIRF